MRPESSRKTLSLGPAPYHGLRPDGARAFPFAATLQSRLPESFGNSTIIVQNLPIFHAAALIAIRASPSGLHFQLQLGMKLLPPWVS